MAREVCVMPCPPDEIIPKITIPFMGEGMLAQADFALTGGCDGCQIATNFMIQLQPLLGSFGLPLCLLGCMTSFISLALSLEDALGPPPDPSAIIAAIAQVVERCQCVIKLAMPPPAGPICEFLLMLRDIIIVIKMVSDCIIGLIRHLITLNLSASLLLGDPDTEKAGACLAAQVQRLCDALRGKMDPVTKLWQVIQPIIQLLAAVTPDPFSSTMDQLATGFIAFGDGFSVGAPPGDVLDALTTFQEILTTTVEVMNTVVAICPE